MSNLVRLVLRKCLLSRCLFYNKFPCRLIYTCKGTFLLPLLVFQSIWLASNDLGRSYERISYSEQPCFSQIEADTSSAILTALALDRHWGCCGIVKGTRHKLLIAPTLRQKKGLWDSVSTTAKVDFSWESFLCLSDIRRRRSTIETRVTFFLKHGTI